MSGPDLALASPQGRSVLVATVLGSGLAQLSATITGVALPSIGADLGAGLTSLQWVVNAYALTLSGLLLLGGSLGDRLGRRRVFSVGVALYAVASAGAAAAPTTEVLIGFRALQGVGGALLTPGSLAVLESVYRREDRAAAVGAWSGLGGVASAIGPVLGGVLVGVADWGWRLAFLINVPLAVVVLVAARRIPETRDEQVQGSLDLPGAVLAAAGLGGVVLGLTSGPSNGWGPTAVTSMVAGVLLLVAFLVNERLRPFPMMPLSLFRSRQFSAANAVTFIVYAALGGAFFLLPVTLQSAAGFSPVQAGSALLPVTALMLLLSARAGRLAQRIGPRWPMTVGPLVAGIGLALLARVDEQPSYALDVLPAALVFGLGLSLTVAPLTATALAAAGERQAGIAAAVNSDVARTAGLFAVAVLPALAGIDDAAFGDPAALADGFARAVLIAAGLCAAGGLLSALLIRDDALADGCPSSQEAAVRTHTAAGTAPVREARSPVG